MIKIISSDLDYFLHGDFGFKCPLCSQNYYIETQKSLLPDTVEFDCYECGHKLKVTINVETTYNLQVDIKQ